MYGSIPAISNEVGLEGVDVSLVRIVLVVIWGHQLLVTRPFFSDDMKMVSAGFIINNLEVDPVAALLEVVHNIFVGRYSMAVALRLGVFDVDGIDVAVVVDHDVLIPTAILDGKMAHIISVELSNTGDLNV